MKTEKNINELLDSSEALVKEYLSPSMAVPDLCKAIRILASDIEQIKADKYWAEALNLGARVRDLEQWRVAANTPAQPPPKQPPAQPTYIHRKEPGLECTICGFDHDHFHAPDTIPAREKWFRPPISVPKPAPRERQEQADADEAIFQEWLLTCNLNTARATGAAFARIAFMAGMDSFRKIDAASGHA